MDTNNSAIPEEMAIQLCAEIRQQYQGKWWTLAGMQCMGCNSATKGDTTKRCFCNAPGFRGCNLVNLRCDPKAKNDS